MSSRFAPLFGLIAALLAGSTVIGEGVPPLEIDALSALLLLLAVVSAVEVGSLGALALVQLWPAAPTARSSARPVSVLIAAWNERDVIEGAVSGILRQTGVELEVIVADDGSTDGTSEVVLRLARGDARVRLVRIAHAGKGAALEAARRLARHPRIATVDADTRLMPGALAALVAAIDGPTVAAGGALRIEGTGLLTAFQALEYQRTTWVRTGWSRLGMLEQLPGALSAFDAEALERCGGFPLDSLTEDYEIAYRLHQDASRRGEAIRLVLVPEAVALTAPPDGARGFVAQRTRWFAGFLSTLVRFRHLIGAPRAGRFGMVRLPLKCIDAIGPIVGIGGAVALVLTGSSHVAPLLWLPWAMRALGDVAIQLASRAPGEPLAPLVLAAIDATTYGLFRQLVVLRAYPFAAARVRTWERSRIPASIGASSMAADALDAPAE